MGNSHVARTQNFDSANWKKSTRSNGTGGNNCVEINRGHDVTGIRDTKLEHSPIFAVSTADWTALIRSTEQS